MQNAMVTRTAHTVEMKLTPTIPWPPVNSGSGGDVELAAPVLERVGDCVAVPLPYGAFVEVELSPAAVLGVTVGEGGEGGNVTVSVCVIVLVIVVSVHGSFVVSCAET